MTVAKILLLLEGSPLIRRWGSVMVWVGISSPVRTELVFIRNGSLTAHRYFTEILEEAFPGYYRRALHFNAR